MVRKSSAGKEFCEKIQISAKTRLVKQFLLTHNLCFLYITDSFLSVVSEQVWLGSCGITKKSSRKGMERYGKHPRSSSNTFLKTRKKNIVSLNVPKPS